MPSYVPWVGSNSTDGKLVAIAATSTPGTEIHDVVAGTTHLDEVFIYVCNTTAANITVTLEVGGTAAANQVVDSIPSKAGFVLILPGLRCQNATAIDAFAGATGCNALVLVNRILLTEGLTGA